MDLVAARQPKRDPHSRPELMNLFQNLFLCHIELSSRGRHVLLRRAILGVVSYAHSQGIVHRDVRLDNIVLLDRNKDRTVLLGWELAVYVGADGAYVGPYGISGHDSIEVQEQRAKGDHARIRVTRFDDLRSLVLSGLVLQFSIYEVDEFLGLRTPADFMAFWRKRLTEDIMHLYKTIPLISCDAAAYANFANELADYFYSVRDSWY